MSKDQYLQGYSSQRTQTLFRNLSPCLLAYSAPDTLSCSYPCLGFHSLNPGPGLRALVTFRTQTFTKMAGFLLLPYSRSLECFPSKAKQIA